MCARLVSRLTRRSRRPVAGVGDNRRGVGRHSGVGFKRPHWFVSLFTLAIACAETDTPAFDEWAGTVDTLAGGTIVSSSPGDGLWTSSPLMITEDLRLGSADGDGPEIFGQIAAVGVDRLHRLYVLNGHAQAVRVFKGSGNYVRTIGRLAQVPASFVGQSAWLGMPTGGFGSQMSGMHATASLIPPGPTSRVILGSCRQ